MKVPNCGLPVIRYTTASGKTAGSLAVTRMSAKSSGKNPAAPAAAVDLRRAAIHTRMHLSGVNWLFANAAAGWPRHGDM